MHKIVIVFAAACLGAVVGVLAMLPWLRIDDRLVDRCRAEIAELNRLEQADQKEFTACFAANPELRKRIRILRAIVDAADEAGQTNELAIVRNGIQSVPVMTLKIGPGGKPMGGLQLVYMRFSGGAYLGTASQPYKD